MNTSLLHKAKGVPTIKGLKVKPKKGEIELVVAYVKGDISLKQYQVAMGFNTKSKGSVSHRVGSLLRHACTNGHISVSFRK